MIVKFLNALNLNNFIFIFMLLFIGNVSANEINDVDKYNNLFIEQPVLPKNISTLFAYISTSKHDNKIKKMLAEIAKDTGNKNAIMYIGSQTTNIDKYLSLINCPLYGKSDPIIVIEEKTGNKQCYFFHPDDIIEVYSILSEYKKYLKGDNKSLNKLKIEDIISSELKNNENKEINSAVIEGIRYLADLLLNAVEK